MEAAHLRAAGGLAGWLAGCRPAGRPAPVGMRNSYSEADGSRSQAASVRDPAYRAERRAKAANSSGALCGFGFGSNFGFSCDGGQLRQRATSVEQRWLN